MTLAYVMRSVIIFLSQFNPITNIRRVTAIMKK